MSAPRMVFIPELRETIAKQIPFPPDVVTAAFARWDAGDAPTCFADRVCFDVFAQVQRAVEAEDAAAADRKGGGA